MRACREKQKLFPSMSFIQANRRGCGPDIGQFFQPEVMQSIKIPQSYAKLAVILVNFKSSQIDNQEYPSIIITNMRELLIGKLNAVILSKLNEFHENTRKLFNNLIQKQHIQNKQLKEVHKIAWRWIWKGLGEEEKYDQIHCRTFSRN